MDKNQTQGILSKFRNYLLTGLIIVGPVILTIAIIMWLVNFVDSIFLMVINLFPHSYVPKEASVPGVGVIVVLAFLVFIGMVGKNYLGKYILSFGENFLKRVPIVKFIYSTIKQIFDTVFSSNGKAFKSAVLVEFPTKDSWTIGFVTSEDQDKTIKEPFVKKYGKDRDIISLFVPATPNPTSGFLLYVPRENVIKLDIPPNIAMKIILSGGMISPSEINQEEKK